MKSKYHLILLFILLSIFNTSGQAPAKNFQEYSVGWYQYFLNAKLTDKWFMYFDGAYRAYSLVESPYLFSLRPGIGYQVSNQTSFTLGYAYFSSISYNQVGNWMRPEHRPYQQLFINGNEGRFNFSHRIRSEERFIQKSETEDNFGFNMRFRYQLNFQIPLFSKKIEPKEPFLIIADEIFFNAGHSIVYNYFDQNRVITGIGYKINDNFTINLHYIYIFAQKASGDSYDEVHTVRIALFHNLDLRKKEE